MASSLFVNIVTPQRSTYTGPAADVLVPGSEGQFDVLPDHDAFLALVRPGVVRVSTPEGPLAWVVGYGFAEVGGDHVTLLIDSAVAVDEIDKTKARAEYDEAIKHVATFDTPNEAKRQAEAKLALAQAKFEAAL